MGANVSTFNMFNRSFVHQSYRDFLLFKNRIIFVSSVLLGSYLPVFYYKLFYAISVINSPCGHTSLSSRVFNSICNSIIYVVSLYE